MAAYDLIAGVFVLLFQTRTIKIMFWAGVLYFVVLLSCKPKKKTKMEVEKCMNMK